MWRAEVGGGLLYDISQAPGSRIRSRAIALKYTIKLGLAHYLRKRDRLTLVLIHVMESDLACEVAPFPSLTGSVFADNRICALAAPSARTFLQLSGDAHSLRTPSQCHSLALSSSASPPPIAPALPAKLQAQQRLLLELARRVHYAHARGLM